MESKLNGMNLIKIVQFEQFNKNIPKSYITSKNFPSSAFLDSPEFKNRHILVIFTVKTYPKQMFIFG